MRRTLAVPGRLRAPEGLTPPPAAVGHVLTGVTLVVSLVFSLGPDAGRMSFLVAAAISLTAAGSVWLSTRRPVAALGLVTVLALGLPLVGSTFEVMDLVVVLVVFQVALASDLSPWVLAGVCLTALTVQDAWHRSQDDQSFMQPTVVYPLLMTALAVGLGLQSRQVRRQHAELDALRDAERARAVLDERRRIARDLHDVAAHHLSAVVVRAKLAQRINTVEALSDAAAFTGRTAADTLDSLRQVVRVLSTEPAAPLEPQPGFGDLDAILGRMEAAGLEIERRAADVSPAGEEVELAVVRITQEALANVLRHRGPGRAWMGLDRRGDLVELTIEDDGPATWSGEEAWRRPGSSGVLGMRERAEACGGQLVVGPSTHGGWRISALLPAGAGVA